MFFAEDEHALLTGEYNDEPRSCESLSLRDQRVLVFHLLYAMDSFNYEASLESIVDNFSKAFLCTISFSDPLFMQVQAIVDQRNELDAEIAPLLDKWRFERLGTCTRLILRLSLWELKNSMTEPTVIINEAIELAKSFAELDAYKFVNGVLDEWHKRSGRSAA